MGIHMVKITLTANQEEVMTIISDKGVKTIDEMLETIAVEHTIAQVTQWIQDEAKAVYDSFDPADAIKKLKV